MTRWHRAGFRLLRRARALLARIAAGTFILTEDFRDFRCRTRLRVPFGSRTCGEVFDAYLAHEAARVARGDLAPITLAAHRQLLDHVWRPELGPLSLFAVHYSRLVATQRLDQGSGSPLHE